MNGERGIGFLAMDGENACGIVGAFLDTNDAVRAQLVSMWTAPSHRQQGVGRMLVNEVLAWARQRNARALLLMVTSNNEPAIRFYEGLGFTPTGRTEPYPNDPAVARIRDVAGDLKEVSEGDISNEAFTSHSGCESLGLYRRRGAKHQG